MKNRLETDLRVNVPMATLMQDPSISQLATQLLALVTVAPAPPAPAPSPVADAAPLLAPGEQPAEAAQLLARVEQLSDQEVDELLSEMLAEEDNR